MKKFKYLKEVKVIHRLIIIVRLAIFDTPDGKAILKITALFTSFGIAKAAKIMPLEKTIEMKL